MSRKIDFGVDEYYHVYSRGTDKRHIFSDDYDQRRFQKGLFLLNSPTSIELRYHGGPASVTTFDPKYRKSEESLVDIGAYCLMPNHFHLLAREKTEGGISKFMHKLMTSYSMYFNRRHKRTGALFESRFKATHVADDNYLRYLFAYIHLNPVKIVQPSWPESGIAEVGHAAQHLNEYPFSSYPDYAGTDRPEKAILNRAAFPEYFAQPKDFGALIKDWLLYQAEAEK